MHLVTELLADRRKLEQIKKLCIEIRTRNTLAMKILRDFFPEYFIERAIHKGLNHD